MESKTMIHFTKEIQDKLTAVQKEINETVEYFLSVVNEPDNRTWYQRLYLPPPKKVPYEIAFAVALYAKIAQLELKIEQLTT